MPRAIGSPLWLEAELEQGHEIPTPLAERGHSGRITVRLGPALHARAAQLSAQEGISLNRSPGRTRAGAHDY